MRGPVPGPPPTSCKVFKTLFSRAGHRVNFLRQCAKKCRVPPQVLLLPVVMYFQHHLARLDIASIFRVNAPTNEEGRTQVLILRVVMYFKHYLAELGLVPILCVIVPTNVGPPAIPERAKACTMHTRESTALLLQTFLFLCTNVSSEQNPSLLIKRFISQI